MYAENVKYNIYIPAYQGCFINAYVHLLLKNMCKIFSFLKHKIANFRNRKLCVVKHIRISYLKLCRSVFKHKTKNRVLRHKLQILLKI